MSKPMTLDSMVKAALAEIEEISPEAARHILDAPDREGWHFVDVREPDEFAAGHVPGARSSPRGFLEVRADLEHPKRDAWLADRGRKLLLYCGGGHRSALAAQTLQQMGFHDVLSLAGGMARASVVGMRDQECPFDHGLEECRRLRIEAGRLSYFFVLAARPVRRRRYGQDRSFHTRLRVGRRLTELVGDAPQQASVRFGHGLRLPARSAAGSVAQLPRKVIANCRNGCSGQKARQP